MESCSLSGEVNRSWKEDRAIILDLRCDYLRVPFLLVNIYGPNAAENRAEFFVALASKLESLGSIFCIGGDFNGTLNLGERRGG